MTKEDFIRKWNVIYESKEHQLEFDTEMMQDLNALEHHFFHFRLIKQVWALLTCVDCGKSDDTVKDRGAFNGIQCYQCKKNQDIEDDECR